MIQAAIENYKRMSGSLALRLFKTVRERFWRLQMLIAYG